MLVFKDLGPLILFILASGMSYFKRSRVRVISVSSVKSLALPTSLVAVRSRSIAKKASGSNATTSV